MVPTVLSSDQSRLPRLPRSPAFQVTFLLFSPSSPEIPPFCPLKLQASSQCLVLEIRSMKLSHGLCRGWVCVCVGGGGESHVSSATAAVPGVQPGTPESDLLLVLHHLPGPNYILGGEVWATFSSAQEVTPDCTQEPHLAVCGMLEIKPGISHMQDKRPPAPPIFIWLIFATSGGHCGQSWQWWGTLRGRALHKGPHTCCAWASHPWNLIPRHYPPPPIFILIAKIKDTAPQIPNLIPAPRRVWLKNPLTIPIKLLWRASRGTEKRGHP